MVLGALKYLVEIYFRLEKTASELRRLEDVETQSRETRKLKEENEKLRDKWEKTFTELEALRKNVHYDQETFEKLKERLGQRENEGQILEAKLHETTLQLERSRQEIARLGANQDREKRELERTHIEYEKIRDKYEKLLKEFERLKQTSQVNLQLSNSNLSSAEKNDVERMRDALDKALQV